MNYIVTGCGTDVGKTIVSAILMMALDAAYWKPIESGATGMQDSQTIQQLLPSYTVYPSAYQFEHPLSPHHAARLAGVSIETTHIHPPLVKSRLIIETAGGVLVPLNQNTLMLDLLTKWEARWIVVSRHYLGSINHTLLTLEALRSRGILTPHLIFNGAPNPDTEKAILSYAKRSSWSRLLPEKQFAQPLIKRYATQWKKTLL